MQATDLDTQAANNKAFAARDAQAYSSKRAKLYTVAQQQQAHAMQDALYSMYNTMRVYINYRDGFVAVKVAKPATVNNEALCVQMEAQWAAIGVTKASTAQGIIYRFCAK